MYLRLHAQPTQRKRACLSKAKVEAEAAQKALRDLAKKKVSFKRKQQIIQKGGFLAPLLSAVIPAIVSLLTVFSETIMESVKKMMLVDPRVLANKKETNTPQPPLVKVVSDLATTVL